MILNSKKFIMISIVWTVTTILTRIFDKTHGFIEREGDNNKAKYFIKTRVLFFFRRKMHILREKSRKRYEEMVRDLKSEEREVLHDYITFIIAKYGYEILQDLTMMDSSSSSAKRVSELNALLLQNHKQVLQEMIKYEEKANEILNRKVKCTK